MSRSISCINGGISQEGAERLVAAGSEDWTPRVQTKLHYPYHWFLMRYSAKTIFGESALRVSCLIDGRTRIGATTDAFEVEHATVHDDEVIEPRVGEAEACRLAERYTSYVVRNKRKALVTPRVEILDRAVVHKPFWVVRCANGSKPEFRVMVDGATGGMCVLGSQE
jgi:hypothetical protein